MAQHLIMKYEGDVFCIATKVNTEFIKNEPPKIITDACKPFYDFSFTINHVENGHEIKVRVVQGIKPQWDDNFIVLGVESLSEFKRTPLDKSLFSTEINDVLLELITDFTKTAIAHNSGMISLLAYLSGIPKIKTVGISIENLRETVRAELGKIL